MKTLLFRCPPGGQFHFGRIATDDKTSLDDTTPFYHSDTLASALVETAFQVFGENSQHAETVSDWLQKGKIRFSSLYYCLEANGKHVFFLPKPVHIDAVDHGGHNKAVRNVLFISKGIWEQGVKPLDWFGPSCVSPQKEVVMLKSELDGLGVTLPQEFKLYKEDTVPKVKIHKAIKEDNLYYHGNVFLSGSQTPSVHFYTLVEHDLNESEWAKAMSLLELLVDAGIGGERSVGCGRLLGLEDLGDFTLAFTEASDRYCTLSLTSPNGKSDLNKLISWKLVTRGGRQTMLHGDLKRLKMLTEGAMANAKLEGACRNLANDNFIAKQPYWRFGIPVMLPLSQNFSTYGNF